MSSAKWPDLARFALGVTDGEIPENGRRKAVDAITDAIACGLAGSASDVAGPMRRALGIGTRNEPGGALLLGSDRRAAPADAALYNGTLIHALDYDDVTHPAYSHPSAVLVPALFALAGEARATGKDIVSAYVVGIEVFGKLGRALNTTHYRAGWHATSTFGSIAAAVAAARLLRLVPAQLASAIGIGASASSGLRANFGTMTKPLHAGYAARNGVLAARLAREGFTASDEALTHRFGFAQVFNAGEAVRWEQFANWGAPFEITSEYGIALKPFPSCAATHTAIEAVATLRAEIGGAIERIRDIRAGVAEMSLEPLIHVTPKTPLEGKFSMHYCVANALLDGTVDLATFSEAKLRDPRIAPLIGKTRMEVDERVREDSEFASVITLTLEDGSRHEKLVPLAIGKPARWFSRERLQQKFADCAAGILPKDRVREAFESAQALDRLPTLDPLLRQLSATRIAA
ncbi:MAG: MmgE/PrpD family protein [Alphaproteobacteria bacterium]|nr:MmgE/PrpD family protein [Alphaproteobacteria bacterium]